MKHSLAAWAVLAGLLFAGVAHMAWCYARLPAEVASHFDGAGNPDGWVPKKTFMAWHAATLFAIAAVFSGVVLLIAHLPPSLVNMPNREYWLAPERRKESLRTLSRNCLWFANATILFMIVIMHLVCQANWNPPPKLQTGVWIAFGIYMTFLAIWIVRLFLSFRLPKDRHP